MDTIAELGEEVVPLVIDVCGHLGAQLHHQPVKVEITSVALLEVFEQPLDAGVVFELLVRQHIALLQVLAHRGVEVLLLGNGVPDQLDRQRIHQLLAGLAAGRSVIELREEVVDLTVVGGQLRNHIAAMPHGTPPLAPAAGFSGCRITGSRTETVLTPLCAQLPDPLKGWAWCPHARPGSGTITAGAVRAAPIVPAYPHRPVAFCPLPFHGTRRAQG